MSLGMLCFNMQGKDTNLIECDSKIAQESSSHAPLEILRLKNCSHHLPRSIYQRGGTRRCRVMNATRLILLCLHFMCYYMYVELTGRKILHVCARAPPAF